MDYYKTIRREVVKVNNNRGEKLIIEVRAKIMDKNQYFVACTAFMFYCYIITNSTFCILSFDTLYIPSYKDVGNISSYSWY